MKQTKFFISISAAILSVAGFVATKASTKFTQFNQAHFTGAPGTLNAIARLTSVNSGTSQRTIWLATRATLGNPTNLHTAVTISFENIRLYLK